MVAVLQFFTVAKSPISVLIISGDIRQVGYTKGEVSTIALSTAKGGALLWLRDAICRYLWLWVWWV